MESFFLGLAIVPGILALLLLGILAYFYKRNWSDHRSVQENMLAFSHLDVDSSRLLSPGEIAPGLERILERLFPILHSDRVAIYLTGPWRATMPSVQRGFSD